MRFGSPGPSAVRHDLCDEADGPIGESCALMPESLDGRVLALMLLRNSRRATRVDDSGALFPLDDKTADTGIGGDRAR
jgi:RNA polymerase sigma-70 factor (ECF subfamily)